MQAPGQNRNAWTTIILEQNHLDSRVTLSNSELGNDAEKLTSNLLKYIGCLGT
jgi:hypothetical protein